MAKRGATARCGAGRDAAAGGEPAGATAGAVSDKNDGDEKAGVVTPVAGLAWAPVEAAPGV